MLVLEAACEVNASVVSLPQQDSNSQVAGGGVSVYYSHVLQMLFFSYSQGKSFAATVSRTTLEVLQLFSINIKRWEGALQAELPRCLRSAGGSSGPVLVSVRNLVKLCPSRPLPFEGKRQPVLAGWLSAWFCPPPCRPQAVRGSLGTAVTQEKHL